jgi:hypothetical protein
MTRSFAGSRLRFKHNNSHIVLDQTRQPWRTWRVADMARRAESIVAFYNQHGIPTTPQCGGFP